MWNIFFFYDFSRNFLCAYERSSNGVSHNWKIVLQKVRCDSYAKYMLLLKQSSGRVVSMHCVWIEVGLTGFVALQLPAPIMTRSSVENSQFVNFCLKIESYWQSRKITSGLFVTLYVHMMQNRGCT